MTPLNANSSIAQMTLANAEDLLEERMDGLTLRGD